MDVIVIGGGIIGCSIAWRLAQRGLSVAIYERGRLGGEATHASAGMLAPGGEFDPASPWTRLAMDSLDMYPEFVAELAESAGIDIDYRACGAVEAAYTAEEWTALQRRAEAQAAIGIRSRRVTGADTGLLNRAIAGATFYPDDAAVDPRHITAALRIGCQKSGVAIFEDAAVTGVRPGVEVMTAAGPVRARAAVLAAGAWSGAFGLGAAVIPARGHLVGYYLQPGSIGPILRHGHTYILQRSNGFAIAGATEERIGFERGVNAGCVADIRARAAELCPMFGGFVPDAAWSGLRPALDSGPELRRADGADIWLAYGHYRNGILLAPVSAKIVSAGIAAALKAS